VSALINNLDYLSLRALLTHHLSICGEIEFLNLIFAQHALQNGNVETAKLVFGKEVPKQFVAIKLPDLNRVNEWEFETLANEILTTSPSYRRIYSGFPRLDCASALAVPYVTNILRALENQEYDYQGHDIRYELRRVINRQFEWQRGFFNKALLYRTAYMFDGPECRAFMSTSIGLTLDQLSYAGFALYAGFQGALRVDRSLPTQQVGISHDVRDAVFDLLSISLRDARASACRMRDSFRSIAYKPSIFRRFPCVRNPNDDNLLFCPLPELIMARVTNGIYYDVVGGGGKIRNEIGRQFEKYCLKLLAASLSNLQVETEYAYRLKNLQDSPDILIGNNSQLSIVVECKAVKMSFSDKFAEFEYAGRGYDEIAKAVFQIWRFVAHCRLRQTQHEAPKGAVGVVILLDSWMTMVLDARQEVLKRAEARCVSEPAISTDDKIDIAFVEIGDLESFLSKCDADRLLVALKNIATGDQQDWMLTATPSYHEAPDQPRQFPFDDLNKIVPWWGHVSAMSQTP